MSIFYRNQYQSFLRPTFFHVFVWIGFMITVSCNRTPKTEVDMLLYNGVVYIADEAFTVTTAIAISGDSIVATGTDKDLMASYNPKQSINLEGKAVYPGFVDAHCHFYGFGQDLQELDLKRAISFEDMIQKTIAYAQKYNPSFIVGRGWNEENWESKTTPSKFKLDALFPTTPVVLYRVDGHAVLCNQAALDLAGITEKTIVPGGSVVKMGDFLTGMLVDKAADLVKDKLPEPSEEQKIQALISAEAACVKAGLTTVSDAGLDLKIINLIDSLQTAGKLKIRVYAMANPNPTELDAIFKAGPRLGDKLVLRSVKLYCDGALGSRGALLKKPYCDDPKNYGLMQNPIEYYRDIIKRCYDNNFQVNTHCIGDSANALILQAYADVLKQKNDRRWRIEHAQVVDPVDWHFFGDFSIIPSVQPTHATSDMYMAVERLCSEDRLKGAYSYKSLTAEYGKIALGTDFPVEAIDPLDSYFAAVYRLGNRDEAFRLEEALSSQQAILGMTIWAAHANFMSKTIGSLQNGKKADLVILNAELSNCQTRNQVRNVLTMLNGEIVFNDGLKLESGSK